MTNSAGNLRLQSSITRTQLQLEIEKAGNTTPFGLLNLARRFVGASRIVYDHLKARETSGAEELGYVIDLPAYYLVGHSFELAFKAYLLGSGVGLVDLKNPKKFGHDLTACLKVAEDLGIADHIPPFGDEFGLAIDIFNQYYEKKEFEYSVPSSKQFPFLAYLIHDAELIIERLEPFCYGRRHNP